MNQQKIKNFRLTQKSIHDALMLEPEMADESTDRVESTH